MKLHPLEKVPAIKLEKKFRKYCDSQHLVSITTPMLIFDKNNFLKKKIKNEMFFIIFWDFLALNGIQRVNIGEIFNPFLKNVSALWSVRFISVRFIEASL